MSEPYANVRDVFREIVGQRVVEVTQHDEDEFRTTGESYMELHFENGTTLHIAIGEDGGLFYSVPDTDGDDDDE